MTKLIKVVPAIEPISYEEALAHLKINSFDEATDLLLQTKLEGLITSVRKNFEDVYGRALITQTWKFYLDYFPSTDYIEIPLPPLQDISSVKYTDYAGTVVTMVETTDYVVDTISIPGRIVLPYAMNWPFFTPYPSNPIEIEFVCGYGDNAEDVPEPMRQAMLIAIADLWENPQDLVDRPVNKINAVDMLMQNYRIWGF